MGHPYQHPWQINFWYHSYYLSFQVHREVWTTWKTKFKWKHSKHFGLQYFLELQFQLKFSLIINKHVYLAKNCIHILIITNSSKTKVVKYIDSKLFHVHTKVVTTLEVLNFHFINVYNNQPFDFKNIIFINFFTKFEFEKYQCPS